MLSFESDYIEGCHEQILKRLFETNLEKLPGYGADCYTVLRFATDWATKPEDIAEFAQVLHAVNESGKGL